MTNYNPEITKTENMARALYETGYSQNHVLDAIQSKGFTKDESIKINFKAYQDLHFEKRKTFRTVAWISGILAATFLGLGLYFEFQEKQMAQSQIENGTAVSMGNNQYLVHGNFDENKTALKGGIFIGVVFLAVFFRYYFRILPKYKSIIRPAF